MCKALLVLLEHLGMYQQCCDLGSAQMGYFESKFDVWGVLQEFITNSEAYVCSVLKYVEVTEVGLFSPISLVSSLLKISSKVCFKI